MFVTDQLNTAALAVSEPGADSIGGESVRRRDRAKNTFTLLDSDLLSYARSYTAFRTTLQSAYRWLNHVSGVQPSFARSALVWKPWRTTFSIGRWYCAAFYSLSRRNKPTNFADQESQRFDGIFATSHP